MANITGVRLITMDELRGRIPYSKVHIYRLMQHGKFPRAVTVGAHRVAWVEKEIDDWIATRVHKRDIHSASAEDTARKVLATKAAQARYSPPAA